MLMIFSDDSDDGLDMGSSLARSDPCPLLRVKEEPVDPEEEGVEPCGAAEPGVRPETSSLNGALHQGRTEPAAAQAATRFTALYLKWIHKGYALCKTKLILSSFYQHQK